MTDGPARVEGRHVGGGVLVAAGVLLLLERLGINLPWSRILPAALVLLGAALLLGARRGAPPVLAAAGVVVAVLVVAGGVIGLPATAPQRTHSETLTPSEPISRIEIVVDRGVVEIVGGGETVHVERTAHYRSGLPEMSDDVSGGVLRLEADCGGGLLGFGSCSVDHRIRVAADVAAAVDTGAGNVAVRALSGAIEVATGSGSVRLESISGDVEADTGSGVVSGRELSSARIVAGTGSGSIDVEFTGAPDEVDLRTGSGDVRLTVPSDHAYQVDVDTGSGGQTVEGLVDVPNAARVIRVETGSGSATITGG